jgi:hypothetical protein
MSGTLILALDRRGYLQTARWRDFGSDARRRPGGGSPPEPGRAPKKPEKKNHRAGGASGNRTSR